MLTAENGAQLTISAPVTHAVSYAESTSDIPRQRFVPWKERGGRRVCETSTGYDAECRPSELTAGHLAYSSVTFEDNNGTVTYEMRLMSGSEYGIFRNGTAVQRNIYNGGNTMLGVYIDSAQFTGGVFRSSYCGIFYQSDAAGTIGRLSVGAVGNAVAFKAFAEIAPADKLYAVTENTT